MGILSTRIVLSHLVLATAATYTSQCCVPAGMLRASQRASRWRVPASAACQPVQRAQPACQPASINKTSSPLDYYIIASPAASQRS